MKTFVIIPTYNERENIQILLNQIKLQKIPNLRIVVVDDNSPDKTSEVVNGAKIIINPEKKGLGNAYIIGMDYAISKDADILIQMDADLSHDPEELKKLIELIRDNDMVIGSRYVKGGKIENWGIHRWMISYFGNMYIRLMLGWKIKDWSSGYRAIRSEVYKKIRPYLDEKMFMGYTYQIGFLNMVIKNNFTVIETPITFKDRVKGKSKLGEEYLRNTFLYILKTKLKR